MQIVFESRNCIFFKPSYPFEDKQQKWDDSMLAAIRVSYQESFSLLGDTPYCDRIKS